MAKKRKNKSIAIAVVAGTDAPGAEPAQVKITRADRRKAAAEARTKNAPEGMPLPGLPQPAKVEGTSSGDAVVYDSTNEGLSPAEASAAVFAAEVAAPETEDEIKVDPALEDGKTMTEHGKEADAEETPAVNDEVKEAPVTEEPAKDAPVETLAASPGELPWFQDKKHANYHSKEGKIEREKVKKAKRQAKVDADMAEAKRLAGIAAKALAADETRNGEAPTETVDEPATAITAEQQAEESGTEQREVEQAPVADDTPPAAEPTVDEPVQPAEAGDTDDTVSAPIEQPPITDVSEKAAEQRFAATQATLKAAKATMTPAPELVEEAKEAIAKADAIAEEPKPEPEQKKPTLVVNNARDIEGTKKFYGDSFTEERSALLAEAFYMLGVAIRAEGDAKNAKDKGETEAFNRSNNKRDMFLKNAIKKEAEAFALGQSVAKAA